MGIIFLPWRDDKKLNYHIKLYNVRKGWELFLKLGSYMSQGLILYMYNIIDEGNFNEINACSKRRSIHAPNLTDELSTAEECHLNKFGSAD